MLLIFWFRDWKALFQVAWSLAYMLLIIRVGLLRKGARYKQVEQKKHYEEEAETDLVSKSDAIF